MRKRTPGGRRELVELLRRQGIEHVLVTCATKRRQAVRTHESLVGEQSFPCVKRKKSGNPEIKRK